MGTPEDRAQLRRVAHSLWSEYAARGKPGEDKLAVIAARRAVLASGGEKPVWERDTVLRDGQRESVLRLTPEHVHDYGRPTAGDTT